MVKCNIIKYSTIDYNKILFNYQKLLNLNRLKYLIFNGVKKNKMT